MRILYIIDSLKIGGAEMLLLGMLRSYKHQVQDIHVAYFTPGPLFEEIEQIGIPQHRLSKNGLRDPFVIPRLYRLIRRVNPDVIHTHLFKSHICGQISAFLARVPVRVASFHNTDPWRKNPLFSLIFRTIMQPCQKYIAVSAEVYDYALQWTKHPASKTCTIRNGVNLKRFDPQAVTPVDKQRTWQIAADAPLIGIIGRLEPQKGHEILLNAAVKVLQELAQARIIIIGDGPRRIELEHLSDELGLTEQVIFAGIMRNIPQVMATLDVITLSSHWEGLPVTLLEALAMARPLVVTAVGGIPGVITDGENGILVQPNDPEALATALLQVLQDPIQAAQLGVSGRQLVERRYSEAAMHQEIFELYQTILNDNRKDGYASIEHQ